MDIPLSWLQEELEMQRQGLMNQYHMNKPDYYPTEDFSVDSFSSDSYTETPFFIDQTLQTHNCFKEPFKNKFPTTEKPKPKVVSETPNSFTISFRDTQPKDEFLSYGVMVAARKKNVPSTTVKNPIQVQDHVLAERRRRERLAQRFSSLSSLLPHLKKTDKATVLEDAANYIQELENRVKELERLKIQESVTTDKRPRLGNVSSSGEEDFEESTSPCNPEIEVRTSECSLLIEIYSRKNCISLVKVLSEMQKFGLSIISCSTMPFADTTLVTIVAQIKNDDLVMSSADLVKKLQVVVCASN